MLTITNASTVKFNVGGRHFEVSRDLFKEHTETMLGKLVSDALQKDSNDRVFIDRDGDKFSLVLDYLRYGSIELPSSVPKSSFERDLDFYGITTRDDIKRNPDQKNLSFIADICLISFMMNMIIFACCMAILDNKKKYYFW